MKKITILLAIMTGLFSVNGQAESVWDKNTQEMEKPVDIVVYRSPTCGCCSKWLDHLRKNQFNVKDIVTDDMDSIKKKYGVPAQMASCHTAIVDGYVIEGHVPASDILSFLKLKPAMTGLSVPGMTAGTPGMEMGERKDPFDVMAFDKDGQIQIYNHYEKY